MSAGVPFTGTTSPFLHGSYVVGEIPVYINYRDFSVDFKPKEPAKDVVVGAFYADAVNKFAGTCVSTKIKNNTKWTVVKNLVSQKPRSMNPKYVHLLHLLRCFASRFACLALLISNKGPYYEYPVKTRSSVISNHNSGFAFQNILRAK